MKKEFVSVIKKGMTVAALAILVSACSLDNLADDSYDVVELFETGDPAVDTSMMMLPVDELQAFGLAEADFDAAESRSAVATTENASIYVYGPLHDRRVVRGKDVGVSFAKNWGLNPGEEYTIEYGFYGEPTESTNMLYSTYGNYYIFLSVPQDADAFYFTISSSTGAIYTDSGEAFRMNAYDSIASVKLNGDQLTVNYSGDAIGYHEKLQFGWNDWQDITTTTMSSYNYSIPKYCEPGGYASTTVTVPGWANYIDFVVNGNSIWDNNGGDDWHFSLRPLVNAQVVSVTHDNGKRVSIYYVNGTLDGPIAHFGSDNWQYVCESKLYYTYANQWGGTINVDEHADELNMVFRDQYNNWENNFNMNWNINIQ